MDHEAIFEVDRPTRRLVTPNGGLVRDFPKNAINSRLGIIVICPETILRVVQLYFSS